MIRGSRSSGRQSIGGLSINENKNGLLNIDIGKNEDEDFEGRSNEVGSGA